jgi:hypothetical protein
MSLNDQFKERITEFCHVPFTDEMTLSEWEAARAKRFHDALVFLLGELRFMTGPHSTAGLTKGRIIRAVTDAFDYAVPEVAQWINETTPDAA